MPAASRCLCHRRQCQRRGPDARTARARPRQVLSVTRRASVTAAGTPHGRAVYVYDVGNLILQSANLLIGCTDLGIDAATTFVLPNPREIFPGVSISFLSQAAIWIRYQHRSPATRRIIRCRFSTSESVAVLRSSLRAVTSRGRGDHLPAAVLACMFDLNLGSDLRTFHTL
jgi:hypothetical protein